MDDRDIKLVTDIKNGNVASFEELVKIYQKPLYSFVYKIMRSDLFIEDIVQETFLKIYKNIEKFDIKKKFSTWAFEIAKNTAISYLRKSKKHIPITDIEISVPEMHYENTIRHENKELVNKILSEMEKKYKEVLGLFYFEELSYEEIAKKLKLSINTVRTRIRRGKNILMQKLKENGQEI